MLSSGKTILTSLADLALLVQSGGSASQMCPAHVCPAADQGQDRLLQPARKPQKESLPHQGPSQTPKQDQDLAVAKFLNPPSLTIRPLCPTCEPLGKTSSFLNQPNQFPLSVTNVINSTCGEESICLPWVPPGSLALWCVQNVSCRLMYWMLNLQTVTLTWEAGRPS